MSQDLYNELRRIKERHETIKTDLLGAYATVLQTPEQKGKIVSLLVSYRNSLDIQKQDINNAIKMLNKKD